MDDFDIPIFKKGYDLYREFYVALKQFPKGDRYALGEKINAAILNFLVLILRASKTPRTQKLPILSSASEQLAIARILMRVAKDVRALNLKQYSSFQEMLDEIGRMLGGWRRSVA